MTENVKVDALLLLMLYEFIIRNGKCKKMQIF